MSLDTTSRKKRTDDTTHRTPEDDHRRKRRNRTTQSCLNCHTSKRMCDRKRPCGRCTQLGLTGLCVYEVDDPSQRGESQDEKSRLQKRVAELESVIRELKNKPHPRWAPTAGAGLANSEDSHPAVSDTVDGGPCASLSSPPASPTRCTIVTSGDTQKSTPKASPSKDASRLSITVSRKTQGSSITSTASPMESIAHNVPCALPETLSTAGVQFSEFLDHNAAVGTDNASNVFMHSHNSSPDLADDELQNLFDCLVQADCADGFWPINACNGSVSHEHCGCLEDPASYHTILELSLRLRKASDTLNRFSKHGNGATCAINQSITDLDRFTSNVLGNVVTPPSPDSFLPSPVRNQPAFSGTPSPTYPTSPYAPPQASLSMSNTTSGIAGPNSLSTRSWGFKTSAYPSPPYEDSFMSWEPQRY